MPKKAEYVPWLGVTYIDNGDGTAETVHGDMTKLPGFGDPEDKSIAKGGSPRLQPPKGYEGKMARQGKNLMVNIASQLPFAIPGLGIGAKTALSGVAGFGADRVADPERPVEDSVLESILNTIVGGTAEGLAGGTLKPKMPNPRVGISGGGWRNNLFLGLHGLSPIERDPLHTAPGSDILDLLRGMPSESSMLQNARTANQGRFLTQAAIDALKNARTAEQKKVILDSLKKIGLFNIIPGVGANQSIDLMTDGGR